MRRKRRYLGLLLGFLILMGITGCSELENLKEAVQSGEKLTMAKILNEELPEKEISEEQAAFLYGYSSLGEEEQKIYRQLIKGLEEFQEEITVAPVSEERLGVIFNMVMIDHPEYFWTEGAFSYYEDVWRDGSVADMKVQPAYLVSQEEAEVLKQQIEAKAEEWLGQIPPETDTYGKIKYVYETLIRQVRYESGCDQNQNIRSVFLGGSTVCMGYAKATQYLLNKLGIFCTLVTGDIIGEEDPAHAWNLVKIGERYYYVDTTWGNPGYIDSQEPGLDIYYGYLCCNDAALADTHAANDNIPLPVCSDDSYNYYKNKGCWYETYNRDQIYQIIQEQISPEEHKTELRFATKEAYDQAMADIVNGDLIKEAVQNCTSLPSGQQISWWVYYGGGDCLLVIVWN